MLKSAGDTISLGRTGKPEQILRHRQDGKARAWSLAILATCSAEAEGRAGSATSLRASLVAGAPPRAQGSACEAKMSRRRSRSPLKTHIVAARAASAFKPRNLVRSVRELVQRTTKCVQRAEELVPSVGRKCSRSRFREACATDQLSD